MKFFIDTANVEDIKKANDAGVICGNQKVFVIKQKIHFVN